MAPSTPSLSSLCRRFGVTRLARVSGLDRSGVEVVAAVRPFGHVLQVSQGKGRSLDEARWSALGEAAELAMAEAVDASRLVWRPSGDSPLMTAWVAGEDLVSGDEAWVQAQSVYCPPAGAVWLGPISTAWSSNGMGFHPRWRARAVTHAVLELLERHVLARALPQGWTLRAAKGRLVKPPPLARRLAAQGFAAFAFDLTLPSSVPVAGALLFDRDEGPVPLTAGYACRRRFEDAAEAALLEAAQSRLTEIHGAREDVLGGVREAGRALLAELERAVPRRRQPPPWTGPLARAMPAPVTVVTLAASPWVVKAVSPSMAVSELL